MRCIAYEMENPQKAYEHITYEIVKDYGDFAYGHALYTWDDGKRYLARCKNCGGYILVQKSEYHGEEDGYYTDYFFVSDEKEAEEINQKYDGFQLEFHSELPYLIPNGTYSVWCNREQNDTKKRRGGILKWILRKSEE